MKYFRIILIPGILSLAIFFMDSTWTNAQSESSSISSTKSNVNEASDNGTVAVDQEAVELLRRGLDYLRNLKKFSVQAQSTLEDLLDSGHRIDYEIAGRVIVNRPNKLRTERYGELFHQIFYYDGKTLTLYNPYDNVYATTPAPKTIEEMFFFVRDTLGISEPVSDLLYPNSFSLLTQNVNFAMVIGKEMIGDIQCDHMLFSCPGADFQIWISDTKPNLPYRYIVTDTSTPELLSFTTVMRDWNINPDISDSTFNFVPLQGTKKINFIKVNSNTQ